jgi:tRNA-dihydrouridine synthase B
MAIAHEMSSDGAARSRGEVAIAAIAQGGRAVLAPMSGISDAPFRRLAHRFGAGLVVSEMAACEALAEAHPETMLRTEGRGLVPHVIQIAGRDPFWMAEGARRAMDAGADIIDINMGCPARRVTNGWSGSALMRDLDHACRLIEATVAAAAVPVTLKMRLGWDRNSINAPDLARRAELLGVKMITVHGRTRCDFYKGKADWRAVRAVRDATSLPLVVNGDIIDLASARRALSESGADAVMIGRGACGRPWIVGKIDRALSGRAPLPGPEDLAGLVVEHYEAILAHYGEPVGVRVARKHVGWYLDNAASCAVDPCLRRRLMTEDDPRIVLSAISEAFAEIDLKDAA